MPVSRERFSIKVYDPGDAQATIDIFLRAIREIASRDYNPAQIAAWAKIDDTQVWGQYRASRPTWLAMDGPTPIGFTDLKADGCLDMMFVDPDYQGRGVASLLLATVEQAARKQGLSRIFTEASLTARPFFERNGFLVVTTQQVQKRGQTFINFLMEKSLR